MNVSECEEKAMYRNFHIFNTGNSFVVKADSKRFGKQAIVYEDYDLKKCVSWIYSHYRNNNGKIITNRRWTDRIYAIAMSTCNCADNPWFKGGK